jgi:hypothetical protein
MKSSGSARWKGFSMGPSYKAFAFRDACRALGLKHIRTKPYTPKTTDVIDKGFLRRRPLSLWCARMTAWQRVGQEARARPRSPYCRSSFAAPGRVFGPRGCQPVANRLYAPARPSGAPLPGLMQVTSVCAAALSAAAADAQEECVQRAGCPHRRPGRLDQHSAGVAASLLGDSAVLRRSRSRLADAMAGRSRKPCTRRAARSGSSTRSGPIGRRTSTARTRTTGSTPVRSPPSCCAAPTNCPMPATPAYS